MTEGTLDVSFAELLNLMTEVFAIPGKRRTALSSRLKHLQAKRFPRGINQGRRQRVRYDAAAIIGTTVVLALNASFVPPDVAVTLVRSNWKAIQKLVATAAGGSARLGGEPNGPSAKTFAVVRSNALADLGAVNSEEGRAAGQRGLLTLEAATIADVTKANGDAIAGRGAITVLDVAGLLDRVAKSLLEDHKRPLADIRSAFAHIGPIAEPAAAKASA